MGTLLVVPFGLPLSSCPLADAIQALNLWISRELDHIGPYSFDGNETVVRREIDGVCFEITFVGENAVLVQMPLAGPV